MGQFMAEIKSTMEMVLERAARMAANAEENNEDLDRTGNTLLRNIVLPRDTMLVESGTKALKGLLELSQTGDMTSLCTEIQQLLGQYNQHKDQLKQQLETAIKTQMEQKMGQRGKSSGQMAMNPAMHPQYQEELARMLSDLNSQYNQALDQRKQMIRQILTL